MLSSPEQHILALFEITINNSDVDWQEFLGEAAVGIALIGAFLFPAIAYGIYAGFYRRKNTTAEARHHFTEASNLQVSVGLRLDQIDVRANSLTSPIANAELRRQWEECKKGFVVAQDRLQRLKITGSSSNRTLRKHAEAITEAHTAATRMQHAEDNIDRIFAMEQGDPDVRDNELTSLLKDMSTAHNKSTNPASKKQLRALVNRTQELQEHCGKDNPTFMEDYSTIVREYGRITESLIKELTASLEKTAGLTTPSIYDPGCQVGAGFGGWTPYRTVERWDAGVADTLAGAGRTP